MHLERVVSAYVVSAYAAAAGRAGQFDTQEAELEGCKPVTPGWTIFWLRLSAMGPIPGAAGFGACAKPTAASMQPNGLKPR